MVKPIFVIIVITRAYRQCSVMISYHAHSVVGKNYGTNILRVKCLTVAVAKTDLMLMSFGTSATVLAENTGKFKTSLKAIDLYYALLGKK